MKNSILLVLLASALIYATSAYPQPSRSDLQLLSKIQDVLADAQGEDYEGDDILAQMSDIQDGMQDSLAIVQGEDKHEEDYEGDDILAQMSDLQDGMQDELAIVQEEDKHDEDYEGDDMLAQMSDLEDGMQDELSVVQEVNDQDVAQMLTDLLAKMQGDDNNVDSQHFRKFQNIFREIIGIGKHVAKTLKKVTNLG